MLGIFGGLVVLWRFWFVGFGFLVCSVGFLGFKFRKNLWCKVGDFVDFGFGLLRFGGLRASGSSLQGSLSKLGTVKSLESAAQVSDLGVAGFRHWGLG